MTEPRHLGRFHAESRLAPENRIYVNRNLRLASIGSIGFDLDHTLAHYRGPAVEALAFRLASRYLVERLGYPEALIDIPYDRSFVIRGLVVDKRRGNVLKMDGYNYVSRGFHGRRALSHDERKAIYRTGRIRMGSDAYVAVDTMFHLPEVFLYLSLVDLLERERGRKARAFPRVFDDVRQSVDAVHADGSLKSEIVKNLGTYIRKDPRLTMTLRELSRAGKKLFLLTNSEYYYTDALLRYLVNGGKHGPRDWRELFDIIIVEARKPGFFTDLGRRPQGGTPEPGPTPVYRGGSARFLEKKLGFRGDQVLYFGDHTYGDILRSKKTLGWRTAMVIEELKDELDITAKLLPQLEELNHWKALRGVLESDLSAVEVDQRKTERKLEGMNGGGGEKLKRRLSHLAEEQERLEGELENVQRMTAHLGETVNETYNSRWGPLFREGRELSRFGHQVKDFACIYMTRVSNLLYYDVNQYFRSGADRMPHEQF
jgi:HAD superfamily 5'-nucleotidase-like hydrolase